MSNKQMRKALNGRGELKQRTEEANTNTQRPKRVPLSIQSRLKVPSGLKKEGYAYRWILNKPERVDSFKEAWWEPCHDELGNIIKKSSGNDYLLLYRTKEEYHIEDLKEVHQRPIDLLKQKAKFSPSDAVASEYLPSGHDSVLTINN